MDPRETLLPRPSSVGAARRLVRSVGRDCLPDDLVETAELLVSELVSNAVVHAGTPIDLEVSVEGGEMLVRVGDGSPQRPAVRSYGDNAATGRGLRLVDDLADDWGVTPGDRGKSVWFRLCSEAAGPVRSGLAQTEREQSPSVPQPAADNVRVELVDVPLVLHADWQRKAAALLREDLLIVFESDDDESFEEVVRHAECSAAMGLLSDAIPELDGVEEPCSDSADECFQSVVMEVPTDTVGHFRTLDETLDRALGLADSDALLALPTDSRTRRFRRWVCRQVQEQAAGRSPEPWRSS